MRKTYTPMNLLYLTSHIILSLLICIEVGTYKYNAVANYYKLGVKN